MSIFNDEDPRHFLGAEHGAFGVAPAPDDLRGQGTNSSVDPLGPGPDRRSVPRFRAVFRPACVRVGELVEMGMVRDMSHDGAMIELDRPLDRPFDRCLDPGRRIAYFWNEKHVVAATVVWAESNRYGLANMRAQRVFDTEHSYRSVRVPCMGQVEVWGRGEQRGVTVANLSLGGMRVRGLTADTGAPLTLRFAGIELYNASPVWSRMRETGLRFAERLNRSELSAILAHESIRFDPGGHGRR